MKKYDTRRLVQCAQQIADSGYDTRRLVQCAQQIADSGRDLAARGWTPATSSNFSMRLDENHAAITISGRDKGQLSADDVMVIDRHGQAVDRSVLPSAETLLHTHIYARYPDVGVVLHTHSHNQTVASRLWAKAGTVRLTGWELLKAIGNTRTHETAISVPVFPNTQSIPELVECVDAYIDSGVPLYGYLIDGHGIYTWGHDMPEARRHLEAFEFLLACELDLRRLSP